MDIAIGPLEPGELSFVLSSWKTSHRRYCRMGTDAYYRLQGAVCDEILSHYPLLLAARPVDAPNLLIGWICAEPSSVGVLVHWVCVKRDYWHQLVGKRLLAAALDQLSERSGPGVYFTHRSRFDAVAKRHQLEHLSIDRALRVTREPLQAVGE